MADQNTNNDAVENGGQPKRRRTLRQEIRRRIVATAVGFVLYVLSIGPMYWTYYDAKYNTGPLWIAVIYEPLFYLCLFIPPLSWIVDAYVMWWIG